MSFLQILSVCLKLSASTYCQRMFIACFGLVLFYAWSKLATYFKIFGYFPTFFAKCNITILFEILDDTKKLNMTFTKTIILPWVQFFFAIKFLLETYIGLHILFFLTMQSFNVKNVDKLFKTITVPFSGQMFIKPLIIEQVRIRLTFFASKILVTKKNRVPDNILFPIKYIHLKVEKWISQIEKWIKKKNRQEE